MCRLNTMSNKRVKIARGDFGAEAEVLFREKMLLQLQCGQHCAPVEQREPWEVKKRCDRAMVEKGKRNGNLDTSRVCRIDRSTCSRNRSTETENNNDEQ